MNELVDINPVVEIQPAEYNRLLGYPRDFELTGRARELAGWARDWYAQHGRPWIYSREAERVELKNGGIRIDGVSFTSKRLMSMLEQAEAHSAMLVALSAGPELEEEAQRLWRDEKPDEYFFLEIYGSAVVEYLTMMAGARLCSRAEQSGMAVLPHYSPGYPEWDIAEQPCLLDLMRRGLQDAVPSSIEVLESGALRPKKSLIALFGLTRKTEHLRRLTDLVPCENCSYSPCQFRRAPYSRTPAYMQVESFETAQTPAALARNPKYATNVRALRRWASERLKLERREDGSVDAVFRYDGTTCTNMGRPLAFYYHVVLGPRDDGYPIRHQHCGPVPGDTGHTYMCRYIKAPKSLMDAIENERPLAGCKLDDVLAWPRPAISAGCYCEPASREHKWGLVLETIHYALLQQETKQP